MAQDPSRLRHPQAAGYTGYSTVPYDPRAGEWYRSGLDFMSPTGQMMQQNPELGQMMQYGASARSVPQFSAPGLGPGGPPILPSAGAVARGERQVTGYDRMMDFGERAKAMADDYRSRGIRGVLPQAAVTGMGERFGRGLMQEEVGRQRGMMRSQAAEDRLRLGEAIGAQQSGLARQQAEWQKKMRGYGQKGAQMGTGAQLSAWQS